LLPLPAGFVSSAAYDINNAGVIAGNVSRANHSSFDPVAAIWRPRADGYEVQVLGGLPGHPYSAALAINNVGDVVGGSGVTGYGYQWRNAVRFGEFGPEPILDWMTCSDVNDQRVVIDGTRQVDLDTMQVTDVGLPPGNWMGAIMADVNDRNDMAGRVMNFGSSCNNFSARYLSGIGWDVFGGCGNVTSATAINNRRDVLYYFQNTACRVRFEGIGDFPPGQLIDPSQGTWYVMWHGAADLNDARELLVVVKDQSLTRTGAALMTPIRRTVAPPPAID
jgi:hypothetical protein